MTAHILIQTNMVLVSRLAFTLLKFEFKLKWLKLFLLDFEVYMDFLFSGFGAFRKGLVLLSRYYFLYI